MASKGLWLSANLTKYPSENRPWVMPTAQLSRQGLYQVKLGLCGSVRRFAPLHSGFLQANSRVSALAVNSWLRLLSMSSIRFSHRGFPSLKFAPILGAHPSFDARSNGKPPGPAAVDSYHRFAGPDGLLSCPLQLLTTPMPCATKL